MPRNQRLYDFLRHYYREVKIQREGEPFRYKLGNGPDGEREIERLDSGEEYAICCPVCRDRRFRLNVNHTFGSTIDGVQMWMAHCWNEDCEIVPVLRRSYRDFCELAPEQLVEGGAAAERLDGPVRIQEIADDCAKNLLTFAGIRRVDTLPEGHPALVYLEKRKYPARQMGSHYGVGYCHNNDYSARLANNRLIIPVLYGGRCVGWQSRVIDGHTRMTRDKQAKADKKWPWLEPKYWTAPGYRKAFFLYGYDLAGNFDDVVVVEGPMDAWRVGFNGVAIFGRRISYYQAHVIADTWAPRPGKIILVSDPGFEEDWEKNKFQLDQIVKIPGKVALFHPRDRDAGEHEHGELWHRIESAVGPVSRRSGPTGPR